MLASIEPAASARAARRFTGIVIAATPTVAIGAPAGVFVIEKVTSEVSP